MKEGKHFKNKSKNRLRVILLIVFIIIIAIIILKFVSENKPNSDELINSIANDESSVISNGENAETERMKKLKELKNENSDIIGWLQIENSNINYPVLQTTDNEFYMTHDYKKEYSKDGSLFLDKSYDWTKPSTNLLIYGHNNIGSSQMFAELMNYKEESYYNEHKTIRFTTANEDAEYEIIAVFLSKVYYKTDTNVFRYYYFIDAENEEEFNDYVENSKNASLYDTGVTAEYGDSLMTLSTCSYHTTDGRLAVVAKKIK